MPDWCSLQRTVLLNNGLADWLLAGGVFLLTFTVLPLARRYLAAQRRRYAGAEMPAALGLLSYLAAHTSRVVLWTIALYAAERILSLPARIDRVFDIAIVVGAWLQIGLWAMATVRYGVQRQRDRDEELRRAGSLNILLFVARLLVWGVVALLALSNLGVNITALIAGLGVGGIALALAVQTLLGDLFASLSITLDKPFVIGDRLRVDDIEGTVEQIGIKSTRLRSVSGEQVIIANNDLLKSRLRNFGRMAERRGLLRFVVDYATPRERLERVGELARAVVAVQPGARFVHCYLRELSGDGAVFELCWFVDHARVPDIGAVLDSINRALLSAFVDNGIGLAHATRTVLVREARALVG
jgi:small-conductance mechanosensitive channel